MAQHEILQVKELDPGPFALQDRQHAANEIGTARIIGQIFHLLIKTVEFCVAEARCVGSTALGSRVLARQEKEEVLRVRKIGEPAPVEDLIGTAAHFVLELIVSGSVDLEVDADWGPEVAKISK